MRRHVLSAIAAALAFTACNTNETQPDPTDPEIDVQHAYSSRPTALKAECLAGAAVKLSWVDNAKSERGFRVETLNASGWAVEGTPLPPESTSVTLKDATPGKAHSFRVVALLRKGLSKPSDVVVVTCNNQPLPSDAGLTPGPILFPAGFMKSVKDYGAVGDGVTDDTAAILRALADGRDVEQDYAGFTKRLYFPAGTYLVSNTLRWRGCCVTLQGQGPNSTIIRLLPNAIGYGNPGSPKAVIQTTNGNQAFAHNVRDLAIRVGPGNPGAVGLDWISNNIGGIRNVAIVAEDGQGARGLDMTRQWPGPSLVSRLLVQGFDYGIQVANAEYGPTFEHLELRNQNKAGVFNEENTIAIRNLVSYNTVPAIKNATPYAMVVLVNGALNGGAPSSSAIENDGLMYAKNIVSQGYRSAIGNATTVVAGNTVTEYVAGGVQSLFNATPPRASLGLEVRETPTFNDPDLSRWAVFQPACYGCDLDKLQAIFNSGASTVYLPAMTVFAYDELSVTVPDTVKRIVGFSSSINQGYGVNGGGIRFVVQGNTLEPLVIEEFNYGAKVEHRSARPVALKNGGYQYESTTVAGDLYLEDVGMGTLTIQPGQKVWARQLNIETEATKIINNGGQLWLMGLKTERRGTVVENRPGAKTEMLGTLVYPAGYVPDNDVAFRSTDAQMSLIYSTSSYIPNGDYGIQVRETRAGVTKDLLLDQVRGRMSLFIGY